MKNDNLHPEEESSSAPEKADIHGNAPRKPNGHGIQGRFRGKDIIDSNEAIFRIICSIEAMDADEKATTYNLICGHRLIYIGHEVWETVPDNSPPFPPDTPEEFLSTCGACDADKFPSKRYTRHEIFNHMIDEMKKMDLDTLARAYHVFYGDKITSYHGDESSGFFIVDKHDQMESDQ